MCTKCKCPREVPEELLIEHEQYKYFKEHRLEFIMKDKKGHLYFLCLRCGHILWGFNKKQ